MVSGMLITSFALYQGFQYLDCLAVWMNVKTLLTMVYSIVQVMFLCYLGPHLARHIFTFHVTYPTSF